MSPFIPHFTSECLSNIDKKQVSWPIALEKDLVEESINFVVQINGKKRALLKVKKDLDEKTILKLIQTDSEKTKKFLKDQKIKRVIFVTNRLINIIL